MSLLCAQKFFHCVESSINEIFLQLIRKGLFVSYQFSNSSRKPVVNLNTIKVHVFLIHWESCWRFIMSKIHHVVLQGSVLLPLFFVLYISDTPKIINNTSVSIVLAGDASVLFTHNNIDSLNINMHNTFQIIHKWFKANFLSLKYAKKLNMLNLEQKILYKLIARLYMVII